MFFINITHRDEPEMFPLVVKCGTLPAGVPGAAYRHVIVLNNEFSVIKRNALPPVQSSFYSYFLRVCC